MTLLPKVGVIGAGCSGIAAVKALREHGYDVFFIGLLQPLGAMPLAERQSRWVAGHLAGGYALPAPAALRADMEAERRRMFKRYVASKRHTMQVDYDDYLVALAKERRVGAERARAPGNPRPVAARATAGLAA